MNIKDPEFNYSRIESSILYAREHFTDQPNLELLAENAGMSPSHFQRIFTEWAGVSPKKFIQYLSLNYTKKLLRTTELNLFTTALEAGLSGSSRLHDLYVTLEGMTPDEYRNGGSMLRIVYSYGNTPFGKAIIATTHKGICYLAFIEEENSGLKALRETFPNASFHHNSNSVHHQALSLIGCGNNVSQKIRLHIKGTGFQLKVWEALINIPPGQVRSYQQVAAFAGNPQASRATGSAIGSNPVAYLIPCHRVIQASGNTGNYMWGAGRKKIILGWEAAHQTNATTPDM